MGGPEGQVEFSHIAMKDEDEDLTNEGSEASDEGESSEAGGEKVQAAHVHDGGGGDGAPGGEEGAEHGGHHDKALVGLTEGHGQGSDGPDT